MEKFFWMYLVINPFLDVISGIYIRYIEISNGAKFEELSTRLTPSFFVRAAVLLLFVAYILIIRDRRALICAVPVALCWVGSLLCGYFVFGIWDIFRDFRYMANFVSNLAVLFVYERVFEASGESGESLRDRLDKIICLTLILYSAAIVVPYVFGIGYSTYTDRFGFRGARGFFYSGNDITAALMLLLPISCAAFMKAPGKLMTGWGTAHILASALAMNSLCLIGTKTAFIAVGATLLLFGIHAAVTAGRSPEPLKRIGALALGTGVVFAVLVVVSKGEVVGMIYNSLLMPGSIAAAEDASTAIFSGRLSKMLAALNTWRGGGFFVWLFGTGRALHEKNIEMDVFELLFYYGLLGGAAAVWPYLKLGFGYVTSLVKGIRVRGIPLVSFACVVSLVLGASYLFLAGHVLFSATSGFYFSLALLYSASGEEKYGRTLL